MLFLCCLILPLAVSAKGLQVERLRCEYLQNPLGIDALSPRLSWVLQSDERGQKQTAYRILVASSEKKLAANEGDLWDSGKVASDATAQIEYRGQPLTSRQACFWKVCVWDKDGKASRFSAPAFWEMGLLDTNDWRARWIGLTTNIAERPAPMLRREFALTHKITQARLYICGLGYYELHLNGRKVGDHLLDPGYTRYDKRDLYVTYDVTKFLRQGDNALGVVLGNGWFNVQTEAVWDFHKAPWRAAPKLLLSLFVEFADGTTEVIASDENWKGATGPILFDSIYGGEIYDARLEKPGWDRPGYDDEDWERVKIVDAPVGKLAAQIMPAIEADKTVTPVKITNPKPDVYLFDFGQNFAGDAELNVHGPAGTKVNLRYGEQLDTNGMLDQSIIDMHVKRVNRNQQFQTDSYILKGQGVETWHSRFNYNGFQYVEVTGFPGRPTLKNLRGIFSHSAVPVAGQFECSNPLLNKIWRATRWSYLSNLQGIPTDCPQREKNGWTGDAHLAAEQGMYNFMPAAVYTKWINDLDDEQQPSGELPGIVPTSGWGYKWGNGPAWDSAFLLIPFYMYQYYGDERILEEHYAGMKRYVDYLTRKAADGIVNLGLGDWVPFKTQTPVEITSTAYYYRDAQIVSLAASLLGKSEAAAEYAALAEKIKNDFNAHFYDANTGVYGNGSQTSLSCALYQGLVPPENRQRTLNQLVAAVAANHGHIDTGILGAKYLLNALTENDRADVAYQIASQKDEPSWGWWLEQGATTLWEEWNGGGSHNHIMFGDISAWFYKALAGINLDPAAPGFKHIILKPQPVGDLTFARAEYDSIRGQIVSDWKIENGKFRLKVKIPPNTTATLYLPSTQTGEIREGNKLATTAKGVQSFRQENNCTVFEIASGAYEFTAPLK